VTRTYYCPVCGGRVRVERVSVVVEGAAKTTVIEGVCEKCGTKYTLTSRVYLKSEWRAKTAIAW
jgi:C4-type Zn-finger protein